MMLRLFTALFLLMFLFFIDSRHKAHAETSPKVQGAGWGDSLIVSIPSAVLDSTTARWLERIRPSGILLFRRNIKNADQTQKLIESLQALAMKTKKTPYLILVDQEGGIVTRIYSNPPPPSLLALSKVKEHQVLEDYAFANGNFMKALGINIILAPVADIDDPQKKSFLGHRVVSKDPEQVIDTLTPLIEGYSQANVLPTLKHFPGHGFLKDSHHERAIKPSSLEQLWQQDLLVYKKFADKNSFFAILTSHISLPKVDGSKAPTTYSKKIVSTLIRKDLKFNGLVISDDVEMGGALTMKLFEKINLAVNAGHDLVIVTSTLPNVDKAVSQLEQLYPNFSRNNQVSIERRKYWSSYFSKVKASRNFTDLQSILEEKITKLDKLIFDDSWKELTAQGPLGLFPSDSWTVISSDAKLINSFSKAKTIENSFLLSSDNIQEVKAFLNKNSGPVLFHVSGEKTAKILLSMNKEQFKRILVLNSHYPGALSKLPSSVLVLNINTPMPLAGEWTAQHIDMSSRKPASISKAGQ